jgi:predicted Zn-dependent peptidase
MKLPTGSSIHQLDNGLQVLLIENPSLPMVGVNVVVKTGSAYETFATSGMSHMLEHLLFNGTTTRSQKQLYDDVDLIGGYNNANTSYYYTNFMMVTPAEKISKGMEIQADMLFNSILPDEKFEKEKGIVLEEIARSLSKPNSQMERNNHSILYDGHAMSLPVLGTYATIESMQRDDVNQYYKNAYVPNNMIMSVVGNFESDSMLTLVKKIYGKAKPNTVKHAQMDNLSTGFDKINKQIPGSPDIYHRFYSGENKLINMFYNLPADMNPANFELLDESLKTISDKIKADLTAKFPEEFKSIELSTFKNPIKSYIQITLDVGGDNIAAIIEQTNNNLKKVKFDLPTETVQLFATKAKTDFLKNLEKPHMFGIYNAEAFALGGIEAVLQSYTEQVYFSGAQWLKMYSISSNPLVIVHNPVTSSSKEKQKSAINDKLHVDPNSDLTTIIRQNAQTELVAIHYMFKHKAMFESKYGNEAAKYLHDCFGQRLKSQQNQKITQKYGLTFTVNDNPYIPMDNIYLHPDFGYIRIEGLASDLPGLINFLNTQFAGFQPTEAEYTKAKSNFMRSSMMMARNKDQEMFNQKYMAYVFEEEKYSDEYPELTLENLAQFAREYFAAGNMIISAVSPATPDSLARMLMTSADQSQAKTDEVQAYQRQLRLTTEQILDESTSGGEQSYLFWGYVKDISVEDIPALTALSLILKDSIVFDIREKQGRAYRMAAGIDIVKNKAMCYIRLGTRPANIDALVPQMEQFFSTDMVEELTPHQLQKSVNMYLGRMMFRRLSGINQAYYLAHSYYFEGDMYQDKNILEQLEKVTVTDVKNVAEKYLNPDKSITVIVR